MPECNGSTLFRVVPNETKVVHAERRYKIMGFLFKASVLDVCVSVQPRKPFLEIWSTMTDSWRIANDALGIGGSEWKGSSEVTWVWLTRWRLARVIATARRIRCRSTMFERKEMISPFILRFSFKNPTSLCRKRRVQLLKCPQQRGTGLRCRCFELSWWWSLLFLCLAFHPLCRSPNRDRMLGEE